MIVTHCCSNSYENRHPPSVGLRDGLAGCTRTRIAARSLYSYYTPGEDWPGQPVEELAEEFHLPVEAVREAIAYCQSDPPEIRADLAMEVALMEARGENDPSTRCHPSRVILSPEERARTIARFRL